MPSLACDAPLLAVLLYSAPGRRPRRFWLEVGISWRSIRCNMRVTQSLLTLTSKSLASAQMLS